MSDVILFLRIFAWAYLILSSLLVAIVTAGRTLESDDDRLRRQILGQKWPSRARPVMTGFVAAAWLYATWGAQ